MFFFLNVVMGMFLWIYFVYTYFFNVGNHFTFDNCKFVRNTFTDFTTLNCLEKASMNFCGVGKGLDRLQYES